MNIGQFGASLAFAMVSGLFVASGCTSSGSELGGAAQQVSDRDPSLRCTAGTEADDDRACRVGETKKTTICHVPPGNPLNAHTLCVGTPSVDAHLAHGDYLGICQPATECENDPPVDGTPNPVPPPSPEPAPAPAPTPAPSGDPVLL